MTYRDVFKVSFEPNTVFLKLGETSLGETMRLDIDEANMLIDQLIQATRCALNSGTNEALRRRPITDQIRESDSRAR